MLASLAGQGGHAVDATHRLGEYLRVRRGLIDPRDVGLTDRRKRRVPGLRREELARLAGISVDYYVRIEQGRQLPSAQVLDALAQALQLDRAASVYLHELGRPGPRPQPAPPSEEVSIGLSQLLHSSAEVPAFVLSRLRNVLVVNALAAALIPILRPGTNQLRALFLDPIAKDLYQDWSFMTGTATAALRTAAATNPDDPAFNDLVDSLCADSERFRELWARHDAGIQPTDMARFNHPLVGPLELRFELLSLMGTDGQVLILYHADPGSRSEAGLQKLKASLTK
jgi:transcriptional regulator with XRE-family HTH domain